VEKGESDKLMRLKDELFFVTGEDPTDIFTAFAHYGLDVNPLK